MQPSGQPISAPTGKPSGQPSSQPTRQPSAQPTGQPTRQPTTQPTGQPTSGPTSLAVTKDDYGLIAGIVLTTGISIVSIILIFVAGLLSVNVKINGGSRLAGYLERSWGIQLTNK